MFGYPNPVNEKAARVVAAGVALISLIALVVGAHWLLLVLAAGFWARVVAGPTFSPLARLGAALAPKLGRPKPVPGPPKRFAQAIGATLTTVGAIVLLASGAGAVTTAVLAIMLVFATLESVFAFCAGCVMFNGLIRLGVIPRDVCEECADISRRYA